tara:strand:- start:38 stop:238 length:201 start_codon:yes stop_codon:yes gene_type:complete
MININPAKIFVRRIDRVEDKNDLTFNRKYNIKMLPIAGVMHETLEINIKSAIVILFILKKLGNKVQ